MLSEVRYGAFANYSPRGQSELSKRSRDICGAIKSGHQSLIDSAAKYLVDHPNSALAEFFTTETTLIPIPASAPVAPNGLWTSKLICERFVHAGLGHETLPCLRRIAAVPKSAFAGAGNRPTIRTHYDSMRVQSGLFAPTKITLVDDVLTKGRTSFASARRVHEAFPDVEIRIFAIVRTQGLMPEINALRDLSVGRIYLTSGGTDVDRNP